MTLIDAILQRIADNNSTTANGQDVLAGRREAYEDVLRIIGYYDDQDLPITR